MEVMSNSLFEYFPLERGAERSEAGCVKESNTVMR